MNTIIKILLKVELKLKSPSPVNLTKKLRNETTPEAKKTPAEM